MITVKFKTIVNYMVKPISRLRFPGLTTCETDLASSFLSVEVRGLISGNTETLLIDVCDVAVVRTKCG